MRELPMFQYEVMFVFDGMAEINHFVYLMAHDREDAIVRFYEDMALEDFYDEDFEIKKVELSSLNGWI